MDALGYPWSPTSVAGRLDADGVWRELGDDLGDDPGDDPGQKLPEPLRLGRTCVVAAGSNGSPTALLAKLRAAGVSPEVALVPCELTGLAVAHSAHASPGGYIATTVYAAAEVRGRFVASWFAPDQLAALDATEPNYRRSALPGSVSGVLAPAEAYVSRWGVLAPGGTPLQPSTQRRIHQVLAGDPVLARLLPLADGPATVHTLRDPEIRRTLHQRLVELGWVSSPGIPVLDP